MVYLCLVMETLAASWRICHSRIVNVGFCASRVTEKICMKFGTGQLPKCSDTWQCV